MKKKAVFFAFLVFFVSYAFSHYNSLQVDGISLYVIPSQNKTITDVDLKINLVESDKYGNLNRSISKMHNYNYEKIVYECNSSEFYKVNMNDNLFFTGIYKHYNSNNICINLKGITKIIPPTYAINWHQFAIEKIKKIYIENADAIIVIGAAGNLALVFFEKNGTIDVDFSSLKKPNYKKMIYGFVFSLFLSLLVYVLISSLFKKIIIQAKKNIIVYSSTLIALCSIYVAVYPGIFGMDLIVQDVHSASMTQFYSYAYSIIMNLISTWNYNFIVIFNVLLFIVSFLLPLITLDRISKTKQIFISLYLMLFLFIPAITVSIFGLQRITTTNMFFIFFLSLLYTSYSLFLKNQHIDKINIYLSNMIIISFVILCLIRFEYVLFLLLIILYFRQLNFKFCEFKKIIPSIIISCSIIFAVNYVGYKQYGFIISYQYKSISLNTMAKPYINDSNKNHLHPYFIGGIHSHLLWSLSKEEYDKAFRFALTNIFSNPLPLINASLNRFTFAMLAPETWGHSYNKYLLMKQEDSWHHEKSFNYFLIDQDTCLFGYDIYSNFTHYLQYNIHFYKNGILISVLFMIILAQCILRKNILLFYANICLIVKFLFVMLVAPAGYAVYYYDIVLWMFLSLYFFIISYDFSKLNLMRWRKPA